MAIEVRHHAETQVKANGLQITFDSFGEPDHPVALLIMGLGTQMIHWDDDFCKLLAAENLRVIRFDNRDIGKSTWLTEYPVPSVWRFIGSSLLSNKVNAPYLLDDMADDTLALMDALAIEKVHLVGASMGGMIAQCLALKAPDRVNSLTSIMSTTGNRSLPKPKIRVSAKLLKPMPKDLDEYIEAGLDIWTILHGKHFPFDKSRVEKVLRDSRARGFNPAGVARQLSAIIDSPDRTQGLKQLQIPSLVIHGDADVLVPVQCGIATAEAIPNAHLNILKGMGHTMPAQLWPIMVEQISRLAGAQ